MPYLHFTPDVSRIDDFRTVNTHNVWRYPMRVRLNGPSRHEQPYRKHQRADKHGSCLTKCMSIW